jgi:tRNA dimethylallyltransferase
MVKQKILIIAGPTASGKSSLALEIASLRPSIIVNADAFQVYKDLKILTASPLEHEKKMAPHFLYNYLDIHEPYSVNIYIKHLLDLLHDKDRQDNSLIILVGGSHMYLHSLLYGLNEMPAIDAEIITDTYELWNKIGQDAFYQNLCELDPQIINVIKPKDQQRSIRAFTVKMQTGLSIIDYHKLHKAPFLQNYDIKLLMLNPPRDKLYERCNARFLQIIEMGAMAEVENILPFKSDNMSIFKAIAVKEFADYLNGETSLAKAIDIAQQRTRNLAKRQITWCRNKFQDQIVIGFGEYASLPLDLVEWIE